MTTHPAPSPFLLELISVSTEQTTLVILAKKSIRPATRAAAQARLNELRNR